MRPSTAVMKDKIKIQAFANLQDHHLIIPDVAIDWPQVKFLCLYLIAAVKRPHSNNILLPNMQPKDDVSRL